MTGHAHTRECTHCRTDVHPIGPSALDRLGALLAWAGTLGPFLFICCFAPAALVMVIPAFIMAATTVGYLHGRAFADPACPRCHRHFLPLGASATAAESRARAAA